jgi:peroxiredoxin/mono/diheme cytochrome c family protein
MLMRRAALALVVGLLALLWGRWVQSADSAKPEQTIANFTLKDPRDGKAVALADFKDKKALVLVFLGTECPVNNAYLPVLAKLSEEYGKKGVQFLGINSNVQDTADMVAAHAKKHEIPFPVLKDERGTVADQFGAKRTPETFVLDPSGKVLYQGRIDDQFGIGYQRPNKPTRRDLAIALDEVLSGKTVSEPRTAVAGCLIGRAAQTKDDGAITFSKHVSRILQKNCQECHRPGQIGPFSLLTYKDATAWSDNIREVVTDGRMPPWHADPKYGKFSNDRRLSKEDKETLLAWLDSGMAKGDPKDLPPPRQFAEGWTIGKPDVVFKMPEPYDVPAEAPKWGVPYQYFQVETNFTEDKWVERAEARADALPVVHHIVIFVVPADQKFRENGRNSVLCGTAPGDMPMILEPGFAKKVPKGAKLIFQMHYTPNGKAMKDQSMVGLIFAKEPPKQMVRDIPIASRDFIRRDIKIPAGADNHQIESEFVFPMDGHALSFMPHMHLRGKDFFIEAIYPDGKKETLLSVPRYNFGWQSVYRLEKPKAMPKGTKIHCIAHFDNSPKNPNNPDPTRDVYWGDQTWEEMMIGWMDFYLDGVKK